MRRGESDDFELVDQHRYEFRYNILRGIEVKVSRSDFRNGFVCSGCNYNYVLTPLRLVAPYEVPKGVGLIEYNKHRFSCEPNADEDATLSKRAFNLEGLRVVKRPDFRRIPQFQIDNAIVTIAERLGRWVLRDVYREISQPKSSINSKLSD